MYKIANLNRRNFHLLKEIESRKGDFNVLNESFIEAYDKSIFTQHFLLKRKVRLLFSDSDCVGYIWYQDKGNKNGCICSMYISPDDDQINGYSLLIKDLPYKTASYICIKNNYNYNVLESIGFNKANGTLFMRNKINSVYSEALKPFIEFEVFKKNSQEELRCKIQNAVFESNDRIPLNIEDIYFDEVQDYYLNDGAIFIKYNKQYIGYGQIIMENDMPTIVNFGVIKDFRARGYGQDFMKYLLNLIYKNGHTEVNIRVNASNHAAINLYTKMGFQTESEQFEWKLYK